MYYRIQLASRPTASLVGRHHLSRVWCGEKAKRCEECRGEGRVFGPDGEERCEVCRGEGSVEDVRRGVSVCRSERDLRAYMAERAPTLAGCVLVALEGDESEDEDHDAGEVGDPLLIHPTRVVEVRPLDASWLEG